MKLNNFKWSWEENLNQENINKLFDSIIKTSQDGLYVCDHQGNTLLVNDALVDLTNISHEMFYSYTLHELIEQAILPKSCAYKTLKTKQKENMIIDYFHGKKAILTSTPVFDKDGNILSIISNVRDITELNNLHKQLEQSNRLKTGYEQLLFTNNEIFNNRQSQFIYKSKEMIDVVSLAEKLATTDSPILILGESGAGKDVLAQQIHKKSERTGEFIKINCAAIPADLIEAELFGYEQGAFTGAQSKKKGLFELSDGGTIFLDEIGEMPLELQAKLLTVIEDKKVRRIGGTMSFPIDIRIIAATNVDLANMVGQKMFRHDLYYRLNVLPITIPPLRERKMDIPILTLFFIHKLNEKYREEKKIDPLIIESFLEYDWPGNIRELNNIVERMYHMSDSDMIPVSLVPIIIQEKVNQKYPKGNVFSHFDQSDLVANHSLNNLDIQPLDQIIENVEKQYIEYVTTRKETLQESADALQISLSTLMRKRRKYHLT